MSENEKEYQGLHLERHENGWLVRSYDGAEEDLRIPDEVDGLPIVMIAAKAFEDNRIVRSVQIPDSVTFIGNYAFWNCTTLERAKVGRGVSALNLGTFWGCTSLVHADLPDTLTSLGDGVFRSCTSLVSQDIPETIAELGDSCFRDCTALVSISLPAAIRTVMRNCFRGCSSLSTVIMHGGVEYVGPRAFQECPALESLTLVGDRIGTTMNAMRNYSLMCFVADEAIARGMLPFEEAKKLLSSESDRERVLAARAIVSFPDRLGEIPTKTTLAQTLAGAGRTDELRVLEGRKGYLSKPALKKCIEAANANGRTETAAYLLDLVAQLDGPAPAKRSTGLEL